MGPYARLKLQLYLSASDSALTAYRPISYLDPALRARLQSALQRSELKITTRAKIEAALCKKNEPEEAVPLYPK